MRYYDIVGMVIVKLHCWFCGLNGHGRPVADAALKSCSLFSLLVCLFAFDIGNITYIGRCHKGKKIDKSS